MEDSCAPQARRSDRFINDLEKLRDPTHVRSYTKREWESILAECRLESGAPAKLSQAARHQRLVERSGLPAQEQAKVHAAFAEQAPAWARKAFSIVSQRWTGGKLQR